MNERRIEDYFAQRLGPISELARTGKLGGHVGVSLFGALSSEISSGRELSASGTLTPLTKAIVIENEARSSGQLSDLAFGRNRNLPLATFLGDGRIYDNEDTVEADEAAGLSPPAAETIRNERLRQEKGLRGPTILYVASAGQLPIASICHDTAQNVVRSYLVSYNYSPFGILGTLEKELNSVQFVCPFWIWHDGN
jgi:hypothetical protein